MHTGKANLMACGSKMAGDIGGDTPGRLDDTRRVGASGDRRRIKIEVPVNVTPPDTQTACPVMRQAPGCARSAIE